jgi:hypothetical protein
MTCILALRSVKQVSGNNTAPDSCYMTLRRIFFVTDHTAAATYSWINLITHSFIINQFINQLN